MRFPSQVMNAWRVLDRRIVLDHRYIRVREERVKLSNGAEIHPFHVVEGLDWVGALTLTEGGEVVVVDQYRHGIGRISRELPAGAIDEGESPLSAARRELLEETGYAASEWSPLLTLATEPNRHTNRAHFFLARGAKRVADPTPDATEELSVSLLSPGSLLEAITRGELEHAVHVAAILFAAQVGALDSGRK